MQCKYHPDRVAEVFCTSCNGSLCRECAEEANTGEFCCYECAMLHSVSEVGTSIRDKWKREEEKRREEKREDEASHLEQLSYRTDTKAGYRLSLNSFPLFANGDTFIRGRVDKTGKIDIF